MKDIEDKIIGLIRDVATSLPVDVEKKLVESQKEAEGPSKEILSTILSNVVLARNKKLPICQDTGTPIFLVYLPVNFNQEEISDILTNAVVKATDLIPLRPNSVDVLTGKNTGDNVGVGIPVIKFYQWDKRKIKVELMLKGGGSENATTLYKLPDSRLEAQRDLEGVEKCVLDAVYHIQGKACSPTIVGVGIAGMADTSISKAKKQLFRLLDDTNPVRILDDLEKKLVKKANQLEIGPMGLGGTATCLAVKAGVENRHPATYFVAVAFSCWALRRGSIEVDL